MAEAKIKLSVESINVHYLLQEFLKKVWDKHKIQINTIEVEWLKSFEIGGHTECILEEIKVNTTSYKGIKNA